MSHPFNAEDAASHDLGDEYGLAAVLHATRSLWPNFDAQVLARVDSTNTELMRRARNGHTHPCLLVAKEQTAGKGRMGKPWQSAARTSLTFSLGVALSPKDWFGLSLVVGMVLTQQLQTLRNATGKTSHPGDTSEKLGLKWPNDLWLMDSQGQGRKLSGILIETASMPPPDGIRPASAHSQRRYVIVGIGINMLPPDTQTAQQLSTPAASMAELAPSIAPAQILPPLVPALARALQAFEAQGFAPWHAHYAALDVLHQRAVMLSDGRSGIAIGVDKQGELLLQTPRGVAVITSGEVSVRPTVA